MKTQKMAITFLLTAGLLSGCAVPAAGQVASAVQTVSTTAASAVSYEGVKITFTNSAVTADSNDGLEIDGTDLTVTKSGTYLLSGTCANGSVKVKKGTTGVTLVLQGLRLTCEDTAPLVCGKSTEVTIVAGANTENTLADTENNNEETGNTQAENAVIKCKDGSQVTLCGTGSLTIQANAKNGIKSGATTQEEGEAGLTIRELTLNIGAANDAVNAEAVLNVESGNLSISAGDDALHCDNTLSIGADNTQGPTIAISDCNEGLEGAAVNVFSGEVNIVSTDDCINAANPDLSGFDYHLNISGGSITAYTRTGDGFDSNGGITISGGTVAVWSANTADNSPLDADGTVTISGGTVLAAGGSGGMGMNLSAQQPCVIFGGESRMGGGASLVTNGSGFTVSNSGTLYSGSALCGASFLLFSSPELADGDSCTLTCGSSETTGQVQSGTVSTGRGGSMGGGKFGGNSPEGGQPGRDGEGTQKGRPDGGMGGKQRPEGESFPGRPDDQPQADSGNSL